MGDPHRFRILRPNAAQAPAQHCAESGQGVLLLSARSPKGGRAESRTLAENFETARRAGCAESDEEELGDGTNHRAEPASFDAAVLHKAERDADLPAGRPLPADPTREDLAEFLREAAEFGPDGLTCARRVLARLEPEGGAGRRLLGAGESAYELRTAEDLGLSAPETRELLKAAGYHPLSGGGRWAPPEGLTA